VRDGPLLPLPAGEGPPAAFRRSPPRPRPAHQPPPPAMQYPVLLGRGAWKRVYKGAARARGRGGPRAPAPLWPRSGGAAAPRSSRRRCGGRRRRAAQWRTRRRPPLTPAPPAPPAPLAARARAQPLTSRRASRWPGTRWSCRAATWTTSSGSACLRRSGRAGGGRGGNGRRLRRGSSHPRERPWTSSPAGATQQAVQPGAALRLPSRSRRQGAEAADPQEHHVLPRLVVRRPQRHDQLHYRGARAPAGAEFSSEQQRRAGSPMRGRQAALPRS
jgi:hypothetical protein